MTKILKQISAVAMVAAMATTMAVSASAKQAYFIDPEVYSGDWNPFTRDRVKVTVYGCDLATHATSQFDVANLVVAMRNNDTVELNTSKSLSTSVWAMGTTQNNRAPVSKTVTSPWSDGVELSAYLDCSNGEVWCWSCLNAKPTTGYGTGDTSKEIFEK